MNVLIRRQMSLPRKYILEITVFTAGAVVMIYEIVGSRVVAPYMGGSVYVWTSLIGIILGSLSLGYYIGGKLADKKLTLRRLSLMLFVAGALIGAWVLLKDPFLLSMSQASLPILIFSLIASVIIFAPPSILLGAVTPYTTKFKLIQHGESASAVGNLYAISTVGSIIGTFLAGFVLIPALGTNRTMLVLATVLVALSFLLQFKKWILHTSVLILLIFAFGFSFYIEARLLEQKGFIDTDTSYSRIWITERAYGQEKEPVTMLSTSPYLVQCMVPKNSNELLVNYLKTFRLAEHFQPNAKRALMIGGCAQTFPIDFLERNQEVVMDSVEIDPGITEISREYMRLRDHDRLNIIHTDGRLFLYGTENVYDVMFVDVYNSATMPFHLTTVEAMSTIHDTLSDNGLVLFNYISSIAGEESEFFGNEMATISEVFPQVHLFPVLDSKDENAFQNIIVAAFKSDEELSFSSDDEELSSYLEKRYTGEADRGGRVLTDDRAMVFYNVYKEIEPTNIWRGLLD